MNEDTKLVIIGGGAAGLFAAAVLADSQENIVLLERNDRVGKKICATGNGLGNLSNKDLSPCFFHGSAPHRIEKIVREQTKDVYAFFEQIGLFFTSTPIGRMYPQGKQASAISDLLLQKATSNPHFKLVTDERVIAIKKGERYSLETQSGNRYFAEKVLCAFGGNAGSGFGTDGSAYSLLREWGHHLQPICPSLVQLKTETPFVRSLKGVRTDVCIDLYTNASCIRQEKGELIFCDYGISGTAVFALSGEASLALMRNEKVTVCIDFLPDYTEKQVAEKIDTVCANNPHLLTQDFLSGLVNKQVYRAILKKLNVAQKPCNLLEQKERAQIAHQLKTLSLRVTDTTGFRQAQVTKGGFPLEEFNDRLESNYAPGIFVAGEALDVDGDCGGYNLHFAWCSGMLAAKSMRS